MSEIQLLVDFVQNNQLASELAKSGLDFVLRTAGGALKSRFSKSNGNDEKVAREIARVRETLEELRQEVATRFRASSWESRIAEREAQEPSTESFIERAMNLSIDARVESKRRLIGRLIACRLQINDSDEAENVASTALEIVGACSERQLLAIAAIRLTKNLGKPERAFANLDDAEAWLDAEHGERMWAILNGPGWDDRRLEGLGRVGAITMNLHRSGTFLGGQHADDVDQWLALQNLSQLEQLRDDAGSEAWSADMRARFPVTSGLRSLSRGTAFASKDRFVSYRLDELHLTQAGNLLGDEILETLSRQGLSAS